MKHPVLLILLAVVLFSVGIICNQRALSAEDGIAPSHAKRVRISAEKIPLAIALDKIFKQTGIKIADKRNVPNNPMLRLNLKQAPFWVALDTIARQLECNISLYQRDGRVALVDGKPSLVEPSHSGVFRGSLQRLSLVKDFATRAHQCRVALEFAWQPGFEPFYLEVKKYQANFAANGGRPTQTVTGEGTGKFAVHGLRAAQLDLLFAAPRRSHTTMRSFAGQISVVGTPKMETVVFTNLKKAAAGIVAKKKIGKDVTATLHNLEVLDKNLWQVKIELQYPKDGPKFETYQDWLSNNKIYLQSIKTKNLKVQPENGAATIMFRSSNRAVVLYTFDQANKTARLGHPADWNLYYRTPARLIQVNVPFTFKNVPLP